ncbi:MAG: 50S ribosomal protein L35ae [Candidatus Diapherotrites archaeon]|nr:50S ribosomal protein L35ae [Candidatus Diapherotrites archaeon]MDZ4256351.1 50S ribosomal protein L35ae [archaeon]
MDGIIKNYRRGRDTQHPTQYIIVVEGLDKRAEAAKLAGKKVTWKSVGNTIISGKVMAPHGTIGAVRVKFERGLPGQAIGGKVSIAQ